MDDLNNKIEKIKNITDKNTDLLRDILRNLKEIINGKRKIMYSDIINLIIRNDYLGEDYNQLLLWCNYKIRIGEVFVEFK